MPKIVDNARGKLSLEKVTFENVLRNADTLRRGIQSAARRNKLSQSEHTGRVCQGCRPNENFKGGKRTPAFRFENRSKKNCEQCQSRGGGAARQAQKWCAPRRWRKKPFEARSVIKKLDDKKYDVTAEEPDIITGARIEPEKLKSGNVFSSKR